MNVSEVIKHTVAIRRGDAVGYSGDRVRNSDGFLSRWASDNLETAATVAPFLRANAVNIAASNGVTPERIGYFAGIIEATLKYHKV